MPLLIVGLIIMPNYRLNFPQPKRFLIGQDKSSEKIPSTLIWYEQNTLSKFLQVSQVI